MISAETPQNTFNTQVCMTHAALTHTMHGCMHTSTYTHTLDQLYTFANFEQLIASLYKYYVHRSVLSIPGTAHLVV